MDAQRVMVTGAGMATPIGIGRAAFDEGLRANRSAIGERTLFDSARLRARLAAEIRDFQVEDYLETPKAFLDRHSELAFAGLSLALEDADIDPGGLAGNPRAGLTVGSACGNLGTMALFFSDLAAKGPRFVKPFLFPHTYANTTISLLAMEYGLKGPHWQFSSGSVASGHAVTAAFDMIRQNRADLVFAGGVEALSEPMAAGLEATGRLSPTDGGPERCAPFDRARNGTVPGEGCAFLALEEAAQAERRGARMLAELAGVGEGVVAEPGRDGGAGLERAMNQAMAQAGWTADSVDWVCAAANGSGAGDAGEAQALARVFASRAEPVPVSSLQSMIGETLGAGHALRMCAALSAMASGHVPFTVNLTECDPLPGVEFAMKEQCARPVRRVLVNGADPGGSAVCLALAALRDEPGTSGR